MGFKLDNKCFNKHFLGVGWYAAEMAGHLEEWTKQWLAGLDTLEEGKHTNKIQLK